MAMINAPPMTSLARNRLATYSSISSSKVGVGAGVGEGVAVGTGVGVGAMVGSAVGTGDKYLSHFQTQIHHTIALLLPFLLLNDIPLN